MSKAIADVPANLIIGHGPAKRRVIEQLLSNKAPGERWAVLDNDSIGLAVPAADPDAQLEALSGGCICCADVGLRVALTRLLRATHPQRLLLLPSGRARIPDVLRLLSDRWLAPVLQWRAAIAVLDAALPGLTTTDDEREALGHVQIVALEVQAANDGQIEAARAALASAAPQAKVVLVRDGDLDARLLEQAGISLRPRFASG